MKQVLVILILIASSFADCKLTPTGKYAVSVDCPPALTDAQKIRLLEAYKAEADATIQSLLLRLQLAEKLAQEETQSRQKYFDSALQQTYGETGVKPEDYTLDMNTLTFKKNEKVKPEEKK